MKNEIKVRYDKIKNGICPDGFIATKIGILPVEWKNTKFNNIFSEVVEYVDDLKEAPLYSLTIEHGVVPKTDRYERGFLVKKEENNYKIVKPNYFVYNPMNLRFGALARLKEEKNVSVSSYYNIFKSNENYNVDFLEYYLKSRRMMYLYNSIATGSLKEKQRVHYSQFIDLNLPIPSKEEQDNIANILSKWDQNIELKEKLLIEKQNQKRGLIERFLTGKVRLNGFNDKVEIKKLKDYISEIKVKNKDNKETRILSVTNRQGFILQEEKFDRIIASNDLSNYKIVKKGQFAYNPSRVNVGSLDLLTNFDSGLLSPMYVIFECNDDLDKDYLYQFLKSNMFLKYIPRLLQGSVRDSLSFEALQQVRIFIPKVEEQKSIANILKTSDKEIKLLSKEIELLKEQKKGLMQLLLTGIVRV